MENEQEQGMERRTIQIDIPAWVVEALEKEAKEEKRTRKAQIEVILERHANEFVAPGEPAGV